MLHAPTWRDDDKTDDGRFRQSVLLDPAVMAAAMPEGSRLLLRLHRNVRERPTSPGSDFVLDVSDHPDIADLYLAADVLVSDYSSAIYDFAVTGKPILLFAPDLDRYRDDVRGMYFDYEDWAPGPVSATQEDLAARLADLDERRARRSAIATATSCERFCPTRTATPASGSPTGCAQPWAESWDARQLGARPICSASRASYGSK